MMKLDILAIGSHPDDVEMSSGGTLAKNVSLGYKVGIVDLTKGELSTRGTPNIRAKEAKDAANILGIQIRENLNIPDGNIEINRKNILKLVQIIRKYRPTLLLIPHSHERHPDHVHTHQLCREAWYYSGLMKIRTRYNGNQQDSWRPENYFHFMQKYEFTPSFIVDISDVYRLRHKAILAHKSQFFNPNSEEPETILSQKSFLDLLETRAKFFGNMIGAEYGEPFLSVEPLGINNFFDLTLFKR